MATANNYTASPTVENLHALPHYDLKFKPVSNTFTTDDTAYLVSANQPVLQHSFFLKLAHPPFLFSLCRANSSTDGLSKQLASPPPATAVPAVLLPRLLKKCWNRTACLDIVPCSVGSSSPCPPNVGNGLFSCFLLFS